MVYMCELLLCLQGGCIIRAGFLDDIKNAYKRNPDLENLVLDDWFANKLAERQDAWRDVVKIAITNGGSFLHAVLPCSCWSAAVFVACQSYCFLKVPSVTLGALCRYHVIHVFCNTC